MAFKLGARLGAYRMVTLLAFVLSGCSLVVADDADAVDSCASSLGTKRVGGTWTLTGDGETRGCADERYDTEHFSLAPLEMVVAQYGERLVLETPFSIVGGWFELTDARVNGSCVTFLTSEGGPNGTVSYRFDGTVTPAGNIVGELEGDGPAGCHSTGRFHIDVRCCAGPGPDAPAPELSADAIEDAVAGDAARSDLSADIPMDTDGSVRDDAWSDAGEDAAAADFFCEVAAPGGARANPYRALWLFAFVVLLLIWRRRA